MNIKYISLGCSCHDVIALRTHNLYGEALPFDHVRSSFNGVTNSIQTNFKNFLPKKIEVDIIDGYEYSNRSFRNQYFGFYHHDLRNKEVIKTFKRRFKRFRKELVKINKIIFTRTIATPDYEDETKLVNQFLKVMSKKYPSLNYILIMIIPEQNQTSYYKNVASNPYSLWNPIISAKMHILSPTITFLSLISLQNIICLNKYQPQKNVKLLKEITCLSYMVYQLQKAELE